MVSALSRTHRGPEDARKGQKDSAHTEKAKATKLPAITVCKETRYDDRHRQDVDADPPEAIPGWQHTPHTCELVCMYKWVSQQKQALNLAVQLRGGTPTPHRKAGPRIRVPPRKVN
eukprot:1029316-Amphidinium_carterae.1